MTRPRSLATLAAGPATFLALALALVLAACASAPPTTDGFVAVESRGFR